MSSLSQQLLMAIARGTALLSVAAILVWAISSWLKLRSATTAWRAWFTVLVCGLGIAPLTLHVPWLPHEENPMETARAPQAAAEPPTIELHNVESVDPAPLDLTAAAESEPDSKSFVPATPPSIADATQPVTAQAWSWPSALAGIWAIGIVAVLVRGSWRYGRFLRSARACVAAPEEWSLAWRALLDAAHIKGNVPLLVGESYGPALARLPRGYALIVPRGMWAQLNAEMRDVILRHELAHYTRRDLVWSLLARWLAAPHWFNPLAHLAVRKLDEASEWSCDDAATGGDATRQIALSKTLLGLSEGADVPGAMQAAVRGCGLAVRIRRILETSNSKESLMKRTAILTALSVCMLCAGFRVQLVAQEKVPKPSTKEAQASVKQFTLPTVPREELRYDEKSFEEWQHVFQTELKADRRAEAVGAMSVFAQSGYMTEATGTVLAVLRDYHPALSNQPESAVFRAMEGMFEHIDPQIAAPQLLAIVETSTNKAAQRVALNILVKQEYREFPSGDALLKVGADKSRDLDLRFMALDVLQVVDPDNPELLRAIRAQIADSGEGSAEALRQWMSKAVVRQSPLSPHSGQVAPRDPLVPILLDGLAANNSEVRADAVEKIGQLGPHIKPIAPALLELARDGKEAVSLAAAKAIVNNLYSDSLPLLVLYGELNKEQQVQLLKLLAPKCIDGEAPGWIDFFRDLRDDETPEIRAIAEQVMDTERVRVNPGAEQRAIRGGAR